jgi:hypothetical protein
LLHQFNATGGKHGGIVEETKTREVAVALPTPDAPESDTTDRGLFVANVAGKPFTFGQVSGLRDAKGVTLVTGCQDSEVALEHNDLFDATKCYGVMTQALIYCVNWFKQTRTVAVSNRELVSEVRYQLFDLGYAQNPGLECADATASSPFIC